MRSASFMCLLLFPPKYWVSPFYKQYVCNNIPFLFFLINFFLKFIFGCFGSSLLRAGFLQLGRAGATLRCGVRASHCSGFSCCGAQALGAWASLVVARGLSNCGSQVLECRLSSCGAQAQLHHGMWDLPGPGLEPVSPALAGGFLTTVPPGELPFFFFQFVFLYSRDSGGFSSILSTAVSVLYLSK